MDDKLLKQSLDFKQIREERAKEVARNNLFNTCQKSLTTVMIGAVAVFEEEFGFLWNLDKSQEPTDLHEQFRKMWKDVRCKILESGHDQIKNVEVEFINYDVTRKRYQINMPVMSSKKNKGEENEGK